MSDDKIEFSEYKYGFSDKDTSIVKTKVGLNEDVIREISKLKHEPEWMLEFRLKSYECFKNYKMPSFGIDLSDLNFDSYTYFTRNAEKESKSWDEVPETIKNTFQKNVRWSPVGRKLVYETYRGVELIDVPPAKRKLIVNAGEYPIGHAFKPFFSPDGRWIFYRKERGMGIFQYNTQEEVIIGGSNAWWYTELGPYGEKIVFSILGSGPQGGVWVVEAFDY